VQGAFGQASRRCLGDLLHGVKIDIESGAVVAEPATGHNLTPLGRELTDFVEFLGREPAPCHDASCLGVNAKLDREPVPIGLRNQTSQDKAVHDLNRAAAGLLTWTQTPDLGQNTGS
jgi:hypothetical protein